MQLFDVHFKLFNHLQEVRECCNALDLVLGEELEFGVLIGQRRITAGSQLSEPVDDDLRLSLHIVIQSLREILVNFQVNFLRVPGFFSSLTNCRCVIVLTGVDVACWIRIVFNLF